MVRAQGSKSKGTKGPRLAVPALPLGPGDTLEASVDLCGSPPWPPGGDTHTQTPDPGATCTWA